MSHTNKKRIQILSQDEINELYERPAFNHAEREEYFVLDADTLKAISTMDKLETKLYLVLLIGYFRAKPVIPVFQLKEVKEDIDYLCRTYFPGKKARFTTIPKSTGIAAPESYSSHSLRRGFATWANGNGWDVKSLMEYVGWKDMKSAMRYIDSIDHYAKQKIESSVQQSIG